MDTPPRYKERADGRKTKLCSGKNNTCEKEAKKDGTCTGCKTGRDATEFKKHNEGETWTDARGIRYRKIGGQARQLCIGANNTCDSFRAEGNLCVGHKNGTARTSNADLVKGDRGVNEYGIRWMYNGIQKVQLCRHEDDNGLCEQVRVKDGFCKTHSAHWKCRFIGYDCDKIRDKDGYCIRHRGNEQHEKVKSVGEKIVADILDKHKIKYIHDMYVKLPDGKFLYLDFYLPDLDAVIEFDGKQHFAVVKYWKGEEGLKERQENDRRKNEWCAEKKKQLQRIRYDAVDRAEVDVVKFIADVKKSREAAVIVPQPTQEDIDIVNKYLAELNITG